MRGENCNPSVAFLYLQRWVLKPQCCFPQRFRKRGKKRVKRPPCIKNSEFRTQIMTKPANTVFIYDFRGSPSRRLFLTHPFDVSLLIQLFPPALCKCSKPLSYSYSINYTSGRHNSANRTKRSSFLSAWARAEPELPRVGQFRCIKSAWLGSRWIKFSVH